MDKMSLTMDLNTVTDVLVPVYTVIVLVVLYMFNKASVNSNTKKIYTYEPVLADGKGRVYTLQDFNGAWKHDSAPELERWLIAFKKNFAIRMVASTMFFKQRAILSFNEEGDHLAMTKDFGKDNMTFVFPDIAVAENRETAVPTQVQADDGKGMNSLAVWYDKENSSFNLEVKEGPHSTDPQVTYMRRTISPRDPNVMNMVRYLVSLDLSL
jgi:hypothetical protein